MNKKYLNAVLIGALLTGSVGTFVSCKDYDDDISNLQAQIDSNTSAIAALQSQINSGEWVSSVTSTTNGIIVTLGNGQSFTITNGEDGEDGATGATGAAGQDGQDGVTPRIVVEDGYIKVSYDNGETYENLIALSELKGEKGDKGDQGEAGADGEDGADGQDGKDGVDGQDGITPTFSVENGHLYVQYGDDESTKTDLGISISGIFYVENGLTVTIYMPEGEAGGEYGTLVLPRAALIRSMEIVGTNSYYRDDAVAYTVTLAYGTNGSSAVSFNGKTYEAGAFMSAARANILVQINPVEAGESGLYSFNLTDSHGNDSLFTVKSVEPYETDSPLTRAANVGLYNMTVGFADGVDAYTMNYLDKDIVYALSTTDYRGDQIISKYNLCVEPYNQTVSMSATSYQNAVIGEETDLTEFTTNWEYAIDYYFDFPTNQTANVEATGAAIEDGRILTATNPGTVGITLHYLRNDGTTGSQLFYVNIVLADTESELSGFTWTMSDDANANQYASVTLDHNNALVEYLNYWVSSVGSSVSFSTTYEYADNSDAAKFDALVPGATASDGLSDVQFIRLSNDAQGYARWEARIPIDRTTVAPTTYNVTIDIPGDGGTTLADRTVTTTLTVNEPTDVVFSRLSAYFDGNQATAYGTPNGTAIEYDLYNLYATISNARKANVTFSVARPTYTRTDNNTSYQGAEWMVNPDSNDGSIVVAKYASVNSGNAGGAYYAREVTATYIPFGNLKVTKAEDEFELTIKSALYEGEITYKSSTTDPKQVDGGTNATLSLSEITATDVFGVKYNFAGSSVDSRVVSYNVYLSDDNAKEYLAFGDASNTSETTTFDSDGEVTIVKKNAQAAVVTPVNCTVVVRVTDQWGRTTISDPITVQVVQSITGNN